MKNTCTNCKKEFENKTELDFCDYCEHKLEKGLVNYKYDAPQ